MGKLITVVGNSGVGKTTFTRQLCQEGRFITGLEQHAERPFQEGFARELQKYALANQVDYLLFRAEQELAIRKSPLTGVQDGGLELDFYVFSYHFYYLGYLSEPEFRLCERVYHLIRQLLPPPDLIIRLKAPLEGIAERFHRRNRGIEIAKLPDLGNLERLLEAWISRNKVIPVINVDASADDAQYSVVISRLVPQIEDILTPKLGS